MRKFDWPLCLVVAGLVAVWGMDVLRIADEHKSRNLEQAVAVERVVPVERKEEKEEKKIVKSISQQGLELIKKYEGFSEQAYLCPAGKRTIGYGHVLRENEDYNVITKGIAEGLLKRDVESAEKAVRSYVKVDLSQNQYDALCSFVYNVGEGAFERSTLLRELNAGDYLDAGKEFSRWVNAGGKKLRGLELRREEEKTLFNNR